MVTLDEAIKNFGWFDIKRPPTVMIPEAKAKIDTLLLQMFGEDAQLTDSHKAYQKVAAWLEDNKQRGLLLYGSCGLGKTVLAGVLIPRLFNKFLYAENGLHIALNCYRSSDINSSYKDIMKKRFVMIDDIGQEAKLKEYGNDKGYVLADIVDNAEREGNLLILTTNLSLEQISEKYGDRTLDRLKAITKTVLFEGESLRK